MICDKNHPSRVSYRNSSIFYLFYWLRLLDVLFGSSFLHKKMKIYDFIIEIELMTSHFSNVYSIGRSQTHPLRVKRP